MPIHHIEKQRVTAVADDPISVTIDASDLNFASLESLRNVLNRYGRPASARAFADFMQPSLADLSVQLYQLGFTLVHCPTWPNGDGVPKTVVSDIMAQDLRDQLEELDEMVETYLVVATSRDYIAVANALRRHDRRVVVVAEEARVCRELRMCADEFAILPPTRPERSERISRTLDLPRIERAPEPVRAERPERVERAPEPVRVERAPEPVRVERAPEPVRVERAPEPVRAERAAEPARAESPDSLRLPSDAEVLAEVRRIVAAEGICTPRRLARALCPVDRTATGELRSRIANRIQSLVDSGKLQREKLVVGGTSVETILAREERNGRSGHAAPSDGAAYPAPTQPGAPAREAEREPEPEPVDFFEAMRAVGQISEGEVQEEVAAEATPEATPEVLPETLPEAFAGALPEPLVEPEVVNQREPEQAEKADQPEQAEKVDEEKRLLEVAARELDALVESVLRSPELAAGLLNRETGPEPERAVEPVESVPSAPEAPKRTRSRRRTTPRATASEPSGTA